LLADQRIVTKIPLNEIWDDRRTLTNQRIRNLDRNALAELLRAGLVQFALADCGLKLAWIPTEQCFEFWKSVRSQIADPLKPILLHEFPNEIAYIASEWRGPEGETVILLEKHH